MCATLPTSMRFPISPSRWLDGFAPAALSERRRLAAPWAINFRGLWVRETRTLRQFEIETEVR